jgi:hypothetical protein
MSALHFLILVLVVFRLTLMITTEAGPAWVFKYFRRAVKRGAPKATHLDEGITCPWCVSVWVGAAVAAGDYFFAANSLYATVILAFALSGAVVLISKGFSK